mmetsp:Transcript_61097/g.137676  ORF Transcript_61097/g.137676 Transcript_61097/m.137676 type:complete len:202 (+) Transcript_61097:85-690(+)
MAAPAAESVGLPADPTAGITAALPEGVKGTMDGDKPPMNQVEEIQKALEPYSKKYGHYLSKMRPWREFIRLSKPEGDIKRRLEVNLTHYQINYAIIFLIQMVTAIVMNPQCLIVICVLALVWMAFLKKNDDPSWEVSIAGMPLGKSQRWMALTGITAIVLLCVVGQVFFSAAFFCAMLVVVHGILHPVPDEAASDEVDQMI